MKGIVGGRPELLPMFRKLVEMLPPNPDTPANIGDFL